MTFQYLLVIIRYRLVNVIWAFALGCGSLIIIVLSLSSLAQARPLGAHCRDFPGPFPGWCGCTWGTVYFNGKPVEGAQVVMTFGAKQITATTRISRTSSSDPYGEPFPYYDLRGSNTGAVYGDIAIYTVSYRGEVLTRTIRMIATGDTYTVAEQALSFAFPDQGHWERLADIPNITALAAQSDTLWVGTSSGLVSFSLSSGLSQTVSMSLPASRVQALDISPNGDVWVGTTTGLSRLRNGFWETQSTGLPVAGISALVVSDTNTVWAGSLNPGRLSKFNGTVWQSVPYTLGLVMALAVDGEGHLWVGNDSPVGACRFDGSNWSCFKTTDGLASNAVNDIATEPGAVWFATQPYIDSVQRGGVSRYDLATGSWRSFTKTDMFTLPSRQIAEIAIDGTGRKWLATDKGIAMYDNLNWFTYSISSGLTGVDVKTIAICEGDSICAGTSGGISHFVKTPLGTSPIISSVTAIARSNQLDLVVIARDTDETGFEIVGHEWQSNLDGLLGGEGRYSIDTEILITGTHTISVRVQDDEGMWSQPMSTTIFVKLVSVYLPILVK